MEFGKMFGIDCRWFLFSPPLPLLAHPLPIFFSSQAHSFVHPLARLLVQSLRMEKERKQLLCRLSVILSSEIQKSSENVWKLLSDLQTNFWKSSEIFGKWSEIVGKLPKTSLCNVRILYNKWRFEISILVLKNVISSIYIILEQSRFEPWLGTLHRVLGQDTLLSQCLSPPRCINGYRQT